MKNSDSLRHGQPGKESLATAGLAAEGGALAFGKFALFPARKLLVADGGAVRLGSRAFDLLVALVEKAGLVLGQDELVAKVWPHTVVEENSLRVHVSALRRALGETRERRFIVTVPGHGYSFVMPVSIRPDPSAVRQSQIGWSPLAPAPGLFHRLTPVIGRDTETAELGRQFETQRMVTLVGAGGIGKTTVARAFALERRADYRQGACLVDLSSLDDPAMIPAAVAAAVGVQLPAGDAMASICSALREAHMLLVLDNCEHLIHAAALLAERLLGATEQVAILATSREPLYASGEWLHRLAPLASPSNTQGLDTTEALSYPAIALFVERAMANADNFRLKRENLPMIAQLCLQLDGIPLAIELAAARVESLGVEGLAARFDDLFGLLTRGRRTALPRHAALHAVFDCSYKLLGESERMVLRRLSVFRASFSLESAAFLCSCVVVDESQVLESVLTLAAKSLLSVEVVNGVARYRSLNTTRMYAATQLAGSSDVAWVAERHARSLLPLFDRARAGLGEQDLGHWKAQYGSSSADLMGALDWAFGEDGDALLGLTLCATVPFPMIELGMVDEYRRRIELALARLTTMPEASPAQRKVLLDLELRLLGAWGITTLQVYVPARERAAMCARLDSISPGQNTPEVEALALTSMCAAAFINGDYVRLRRLSARFAAHADIYEAAGDTPESPFQLASDRWGAIAAHYLGHHAEARRLVASVLASPIVPARSPVLGPVPQVVSMGMLQARSAWIEGYPDRALVIADEVLGQTEGEHPFALCQALAMALIPVLIWRGDKARARKEVERLVAHAGRHSLVFWQFWAVSLASALGMRGGENDTGAHHVAENAMVYDLLGTLDCSLLHAGTVARVEAGEVLWCGPEILRARAEQELATGERQHAAETLLWRANEMARSQGALSWELRCALSLARLWARSGRSEQASGLLTAVLGKFTEGFDTIDLVDARALMQRLHSQLGER